MELIITKLFYAACGINEITHSSITAIANLESNILRLQGSAKFEDKKYHCLMNRFLAMKYVVIWRLPGSLLSNNRGNPGGILSKTHFAVITK